MPGPRPTHKQVSPTKLRAAYMRPLQAVKIQHLRQLAQVIAVSQFLQSFGIILAVFCSAKFHTAEQISIDRIVPRMTVPHCGIGNLR